MKELNEVPLFSSAHSAVKFALTMFGAPERPMMNRMADTSHIGRGLGGLDGAGQAGIILSHMKAQGKLLFAVLVARAAPRSFRCECRRVCCSGFGLNMEWAGAINLIAYEAARGANSKASMELRLAIVRKIFGESATFAHLAIEHGMNRDTVSDYYRPIYRWITGTSVNRTGSATEGLEPRAWDGVEESLREAEIVG